MGKGGRKVTGDTDVVSPQMRFYSSIYVCMCVYIYTYMYNLEQNRPSENNVTKKYGHLFPQ